MGNDSVQGKYRRTTVITRVRTVYSTETPSPASFLLGLPHRLCMPMRPILVLVLFLVHFQFHSLVLLRIATCAVYAPQLPYGVAGRRGPYHRTNPEENSYRKNESLNGEYLASLSVW